MDLRCVSFSVDIVMTLPPTPHPHTRSEMPPLTYLPRLCGPGKVTRSIVAIDICTYQDMMYVTVSMHF